MTVVAVEAAKQGVTVREDTVLGSKFADDVARKDLKDCRNKSTRHYRLVQVKRRNLFPEQSPRRFFESDREISHTFSMSPCEDVT